MKNAIARHSWRTGHVANWGGLKILAIDQQPTRRKTLESIKIRHIRNNYNLDIRNANKPDLVPIP